MLTASPASDTDNGKKLCVLIEGHDGAMPNFTGAGCWHRRRLTGYGRT